VGPLEDITKNQGKKNPTAPHQTHRPGIFGAKVPKKKRKKNPQEGETPGDTKGSPRAGGGLRLQTSPRGGGDQGKAGARWRDQEEEVLGRPNRSFLGWGVA